jgi:hypothetical protein
MMYAMEFDSDRHHIFPLEVQEPANPGAENETSLFVPGKEPAELTGVHTGELENDQPPSVEEFSLKDGNNSACIALANNCPDVSSAPVLVTPNQLWNEERIVSSTDFEENAFLHIREAELGDQQEGLLEKESNSSVDFEENSTEGLDLKDGDRLAEAFVAPPWEPFHEYSKITEEHKAAVEPDSDIYYLNETEKDECATVELVNNEMESRYGGLEQLDLLLGDEKSRIVLSHFRPKSLLDMQTIGWNITEWMENGTLESLSLLLPVRVNIKLIRLTNALVFLIEPYLGEGGKIELKLVPFLHHPPAIPLSENQEKAVAQGSPFWMYKRVIHSETSEAYDTKHFDLWHDLSTALGLQYSVFEEIFQLILHAPVQIEEGLKGPFWTEEKRKELMPIVDLHFPLQIAFFTGLYVLFYPLNELTAFPAWQELIGQANGSI